MKARSISVKALFLFFALMAIATAAPAEELVILYSGNTDGFVEPCG